MKKILKPFDKKKLDKIDYSFIAIYFQGKRILQMEFCKHMTIPRIEETVTLFESDAIYKVVNILHYYALSENLHHILITVDLLNSQSKKDTDYDNIEQG